MCGTVTRCQGQREGGPSHLRFGASKKAVVAEFESLGAITLHV